MARNVGAVIVGLVVGMLINMALVMLNAYVLFPMPEGTDMSNPDQMNAYVSTLPAVAFLVVLAAHLAQSFVGGWVAARLCASKPMWMAMIIGVVSLIAGVVNAMQIRGPAWLYIEFPLYLVVAWLAGRMEVRRRAAASPA